MITSQLIPGQHIHIIGISGFGMSAIARVLLDNGYTISGSDRKMNVLSESLQADGATIYRGHSAAFVEGAELVLRSSAVADDNPEVKAAYQMGIRVLERREFITRMTAGYQTIAIAGTHGKTTTSAMLAYVLMESGFDPSYIVGGILKNTGTNAGAGLGDHFVIEADEYGHMFLGLHPRIAVITNIEYDHPDFFQSTDDLLLAYQLFLEKLTPTGVFVACVDNDVVAALADERRTQVAPVQTYSADNNIADWWAVDIQANRLGGMDFVVCHGTIGEGIIGPVSLRLPGRHNVQNAVAVIAVARQLGVPFESIAEALASFEGTGRRSELMGEAAGVRVINDYAHHPTAIRATLRAWQEQTQAREGQVWAVWEPHTYSRVRALADSFESAFHAADHVLVMDIFAAREQATPGLMAEDLAARIVKQGHPDTRYTGDPHFTAQILSNEVQAHDTIIIMSAGDAPQVGRAVLDVLSRR